LDSRNKGFCARPSPLASAPHSVVASKQQPLIRASTHILNLSGIQLFHLCLFSAVNLRFNPFQRCFQLHPTVAAEKSITSAARMHPQSPGLELSWIAFNDVF